MMGRGSPRRRRPSADLYSRRIFLLTCLLSTLGIAQTAQVKGLIAYEDEKTVLRCPVKSSQNAISSFYVWYKLPSNSTTNNGNTDKYRVAFYHRMRGQEPNLRLTGDIKGRATLANNGNLVVRAARKSDKGLYKCEFTPGGIGYVNVTAVRSMSVSWHQTSSLPLPVSSVSMVTALATGLFLCRWDA